MYCLRDLRRFLPPEAKALPCSSTFHPLVTQKQKASEACRAPAGWEAVHIACQSGEGGVSPHDEGWGCPGESISCYTAWLTLTNHTSPESPAHPGAGPQGSQHLQIWVGPLPETGFSTGDVHYCGLENARSGIHRPWSQHALCSNSS